MVEEGDETDKTGWIRYDMHERNEITIITNIRRDH